MFPRDPRTVGNNGNDCTAHNDQGVLVKCVFFFLWEMTVFRLPSLDSNGQKLAGQKEKTYSVVKTLEISCRCNHKVGWLQWSVGKHTLFLEHPVCDQLETIVIKCQFLSLCMLL